MVARTHPEPTAGLLLRFDRDGEEPERRRATDGSHAVLIATAMLIERRRLLIGDKLSVLGADGDDDEGLSPR
jgi:hypothetical protein